MLMRFLIFMAVKSYFVIFWVMTPHYAVGGYKCCREPCCPSLQDSNISNLKTEAAGSCTTLITTSGLQNVITQSKPAILAFNISIEYQ
jgi:hypothetical protein